MRTIKDILFLFIILFTFLITNELINSTVVKVKRELQYEILVLKQEIITIKTQIEFPDFPPKIGIKKTNKSSMKRRTKDLL